ncbi:MAG: tetratricopeptide repeat protein [Candidatus Obscuribacterales bacterium]|nr:tetratricopeptide repeat protein [Candidatus Obscuribacterales bacterium]
MKKLELFANKLEQLCNKYQLQIFGFIIALAGIAIWQIERNESSAQGVLYSIDIPINMDSENNRAMQHYFKGEYVEAEKILSAEVSRLHQEGDKADPWYLSCVLPNYAATLNKFGRFEEAEAAYKETLAVIMAEYGKHEMSYVKNQEYMARFYLENNKPELAEPLFKEVAVALQGELKSDDGGSYRKHMAEKTIRDYGLLLTQQGRSAELDALKLQLSKLIDG